MKIFIIAKSELIMKSATFCVFYPQGKPKQCEVLKREQNNCITSRIWEKSLIQTLKESSFYFALNLCGIQSGSYEDAPKKSPKYILLAQSRP